MKKTYSEEYFINRELSWLAFNERVLAQATKDKLPLLERLKFTAIFSSNLDEFFMIRVAGLKQQIAAEVRKKGVAGMSPLQQLNNISETTQRLFKQHSEHVTDIIAKLKEQGIRIILEESCCKEYRQFMKEYFKSDIQPVATVLTVSPESELPWLPGGNLNVICKVKCKEPSVLTNSEEESFAIIPLLPGLPRFIVAEDKKNKKVFIPQEKVILNNLSEFLPKFEILSSGLFRLTRDADVDFQDDEASDLLNTVEQAVRSRRVRCPIRLEVSNDLDYETVDWLHETLELTEQDTYRVPTLMNAAQAMRISFINGFDELKIPEWLPQKPLELADSDDLFETMKEKDVLLSHPYETFDPVVKLIEKAADDPDVLAIKQTLYRTSGDSPIIDALERAAESGKQVTVIVELKARFDEQQNVRWARRLENAGCFVLYGVSGYKVHSKALLITRREKGMICQYVHLGTGNYHDKTARIYSDLSLLTTDKDIASDVTAFFNLLTGISEPVRWKRLGVSPLTMKKRFIELIEREIKLTTNNNPGQIIAKMNSLQDKDIIQSLYRASEAGVKIKLNVRGICCLKPGIKGVSDNIKVVSIVDRFLEHARIYYFGNAGRPEFYLASADWMTRNLDKRFELLFPVQGQRQQERIRRMLDIYFADDSSAWKLKSDGSWKAPLSEKGIRAQKELYDEVSKALSNRHVEKFTPMRSPKGK